MARPKSDHKRNAILSAAVKTFEERGLSAPTSAISAAAGIAEGTLFTYFKTKDDLINALYRQIKLELADKMMSDFPRRKSFKQKLEHIWNRNVEWGVENPHERAVLRQLSTSKRVTDDSRAAGHAPFAEIEEMAKEASEQNVLHDISLEFIAAALEALAFVTIQFIAEDAKNADHYKRSGFEMLWRGIARK